MRQGLPPALENVSETGMQLTSVLLQHVCKILGIKIEFTTTYQTQVNGQVKWYKRTIIAGFRHYVEQHVNDWDPYTDILMYAYNTQIHGIPIYKLFTLLFY